MPSMDRIRRIRDFRCFRAAALRIEGKTLKEIGRLIGWRSDPTRPLSVERTRQIILKAVRLIKHPSRKDHPLREWAMQYEGKIL